MPNKPICHISDIPDRFELIRTVKESLDKAGLKIEGAKWAEETAMMRRSELLQRAAEYVEVR